MSYRRDSASSADESSCTESTPSKSRPSTDHTYFREKHNSGLAPASGIVAMETEKVIEQKSGDVEKLDVVVPSKSVTTLELHSEEQKTEVDITMATMDNSTPPKMESIQQREGKVESVESKADKDSANQQKLKQSPFSISSILGEKPREVLRSDKMESDTLAGGESLANNQNSKASDQKATDQNIKVVERKLDYGDGEGIKDKPDRKEMIEGDTEAGVRNVLSHIEDLIEEEMKEKVSGNSDGDKQKSETMEVDGDSVGKKLIPNSDKGILGIFVDLLCLTYYMYLKLQNFLLGWYCINSFYIFL